MTEKKNKQQTNNRQQELYMNILQTLIDSKLTYAEIYGILGLLNVSVGNLYISHGNELLRQQYPDCEKKDTVPSYVG